MSICQTHNPAAAQMKINTPPAATPQGGQRFLDVKVLINAKVVIIVILKVRIKFLPQKHPESHHQNISMVVATALTNCNGYSGRVVR